MSVLIKGMEMPKGVGIVHVTSTNLTLAITILTCAALLKPPLTRPNLTSTPLRIALKIARSSEFLHRMGV